MKNRDEQHIVQDVQRLMEKHLSFELFQHILHSCNFKMEHYLQISSKVKEFVFLFFESYISNTKKMQGSILELTEIKKMLNYKDIRSVLKWCEKNDVFVFTQGNTQLVNRSEFLLAFHKPFIEHLQRKCKNWKEEFARYIQGDLKGLMRAKDSKATIRKYKPKSEIEKSFLNKIKKL